MNEQLAFDINGNITEELTDRQTDRRGRLTARLRKASGRYGWQLI